LIVLGLAEFDHLDVVIEIAVDPLERRQAVFERGSLLHQALRLLRIVPQAGVFGELVQLIEAFARFRDVKDASSAVQWTA
jgi:hypothetical protein